MKKMILLTVASLVLTQVAQAYEDGFGYTVFSTTFDGPFGYSEVGPQVSSRFSDAKIVKAANNAKDDVYLYYATNGEVVGAQLSQALKLIQEADASLSLEQQVEVVLELTK